VRLRPHIHSLMGTAGIQPVPHMGAQIRVITLGLPRATANLPGDGRSVNPDPAGNLRLARPVLKKVLNLDSVSKRQMSILCVQGSATLSV